MKKETVYILKSKKQLQFEYEVDKKELKLVSREADGEVIIETYESNKYSVTYELDYYGEVVVEIFHKSKKDVCYHWN